MRKFINTALACSLTFFISCGGGGASDKPRIIGSNFTIWAGNTEISTSEQFKNPQSSGYVQVGSGSKLPFTAPGPYSYWLLKVEPDNKIEVDSILANDGTPWTFPWIDSNVLNPYVIKGCLDSEVAVIGGLNDAKYGGYIYVGGFDWNGNPAQSMTFYPSTKISGDFAVYGGNSPLTASELGAINGYYTPPAGYTLIEKRTGKGNYIFNGNYKYYVIYTKIDNVIWVDSIKGSDGNYIIPSISNGHYGNINDVSGAPDGNCVRFGAAQSRGYVFIDVSTKSLNSINLVLGY